MSAHFPVGSSHRQELRSGESSHDMNSELGVKITKETVHSWVIILYVAEQNEHFYSILILCTLEFNFMRSEL